MYPEQLRYTKEHEWVGVEGDVATVGITDHAQEELGDIVYVESPKVGVRVTKGAQAGVVESVKSASEVYAPATGTVTVAVTTALGTGTSTVTLAPYGPSFSLLGDGKHVAAEIATPTGAGAYGGGTYDLIGPSNTFSYSTRPVKAGETLVLYGVGFGPTSPHVSAGQPFTGAAPTNEIAVQIARELQEKNIYVFNI